VSHIASVVIPTRDRPEMLAGAVAVALAQRDVEVEVLVVDDGSAAPVGAALPSDGRVRLLRHEVPRGVSAARNTGIERARAPWIAFLDDDDLWAPDKLASQIGAAAAAGAAWAYAGDVTVDEDLGIVSGAPPPPPGEVVAKLTTYNSIPAGASNVVVAADALAAAGPFDPSLKTSEDWDMWIRLARCCGTPAVVPRPLVACRLHPGAASENMDLVLQEVATVERRHAIQVDWARHHRWAAWTALRRGRRGEAARRYFVAASSGDVRSVLRALAALAGPRIVKRRVDPHGEWAAAARAWLETRAR
jgi:glycosyltransferase involved in cell wall biosynthesis